MSAGLFSSFEIRLRNLEGVPVIQLSGTVTRGAVRAVRSTIIRLARAGHFNVILNVERVRSADWGFLSGLSDALAAVRSHYGAIELVAAPEAMAELLGNKSARDFRLCRNERQAISNIKKLTRQPDALTHLNARLLEQS